MHFKCFVVVWVGQHYIFGYGSVDCFKSFLIDLFPMPCYLFCPLGFCGFGLPTLSHQVGEWGKHITALSPQVSVVLYHSYELA